jgi:hypothetical protein
MRNGFIGLATAGLFSLAAHAAGPQLISAEASGEAWPFTLAELHLQCLPGRAVVVMDVESGAMYPVNGHANAKARALALEPLEKIWRDNPAIPGTKVSIGPVIDQGLQLCQ